MTFKSNMQNYIVVHKRRIPKLSASQIKLPEATSPPEALDRIVQGDQTAEASPALTELGPIVEVPASEILLLRKFRQHSEEAVQFMADSIFSYGVLNPIILRRIDDGSINDQRAELLSGYLRYLGCTALGMKTIAARFARADDLVAKLVPITENLDRIGYTVLEEAAAVSERVRLLHAKSEDGQLAQGALSLNRLARHLETSRRQLSRLIKIDTISAEAKSCARAHDLDDNQMALLEIAKGSKKTDQLAIAEDIVKRRAKKKKLAPGAISEEVVAADENNRTDAYTSTTEIHLVERPTVSGSGGVETLSDPSNQPIFRPASGQGTEDIPIGLLRDERAVQRRLAASWEADRLRQLLRQVSSAARLNFLRETIFPDLGIQASDLLEQAADD
jgi:ParB/RepB/Spo0J family partition protein